MELHSTGRTWSTHSGNQNSFGTKSLLGIRRTSLPATGTPNRRVSMKRQIVMAVAVLVLALTTVTAILPTSAGAQSSPPAAQQFQKTSIAVIAGTQVSLHWSGQTDDTMYFLLVSDLPDFSSSSVVSWPSGYSDVWEPTDGWWVARANAMTVSIPSSATAGTQYEFTMYTCDSSVELCSNASGAPSPTDGKLKMTVESNS